MRVLQIRGLLARVLVLGAGLICSAAWADVAFDVGRWRVSFADDGARLSLAHADGVASVEVCVKAFREGIGDDRVFLACQGHFTGAEAAYADASRTGADIVHPNKPVKWGNILLQARCTVNQIFAHANVFWSDPDCMLVSQGALEREQAQVETTVVALPGQQTFAGDKLAELAPADAAHRGARWIFAQVRRRARRKGRNRLGIRRPHPRRHARDESLGDD